MISERVYRKLLAVYPKEHRQEYGELMVQLFRDRMRRDGSGFRGMVVWTQMIFDLAVSAFEEHKEETNMRKRIMLIGTALTVTLLAVAAGVSVILAQSNDEAIISVSSDIHTYEVGEGGLAEAMRQAVEEGVLDQEGADQITQAFSISSSSANGEPVIEVAIATNNYSYTYEARGGGLAEAMRQAVEEGVLGQEGADQIAQAFSGSSSSANGESGVEMAIATNNYSYTYEVRGGGLAEAMRQAVEEGEIPAENEDVAWHRYSFSGENGIADALRQAVEDGVISQEIADEMIMRFQ